MRIIPFPGRDAARAEPEPVESALLRELENALSGECAGPLADSWRELREDVRALAPSMDPAFEHELATRIIERHGPRRPGGAVSEAPALADERSAADAGTRNPRRTARARERQPFAGTRKPWRTGPRRGARSCSHGCGCRAWALRCRSWARRSRSRSRS